MNLRWVLKALVLVCVGISVRAPATEQGGDNIEGTWQIDAPRASLKPVTGSIPFTSQGRERFERNQSLAAKKQYDDYDITLSRCSSPGLPRIMLTPKRFRIWQRPPHIVTLSFEWNRLYRQIDMGGGLPPMKGPFGGDEDLFGSAIGQSKGHWEGKTLVVATDSFVNFTLLDNLLPHGYDLKITERIRRPSPNTLEDRITIEDPEFYQRPWDAIVTYRRVPNDAFPEDVCLDRLEAEGLPLAAQ